MNNTRNSFFVILSISALFFASCKEKNVTITEEPAELSVDRVYRPLLHHFGSTGCGGCGRLGVPLTNRLGDEMGDSIIPFITHFKYNDPFITSSSEKIEENMLYSRYSPQVWINNDDISFPMLNSGLESSIAETRRRLRDSMLNTAKAYVGFEATIKPTMRYDGNVLVENNTVDSATFYVEVYSMEDGLIASQAGADPYVSTHYRVNRGGHYGDMGKKIRLAAGEVFSDNIELIPCWVCEAKELYFYAMIWEELPNGKFGYVNGKVFKP